MQGLSRFLHLFTQIKIKDPLKLNMLNMDPVSKHITLERISALVGHNTMGYRNANTAQVNFDDLWAEIYSHLFEYYYQYHLKQRIYLLDEINCMDLERTHPVFHHKVAHKNREFTKDLFSFTIEKKQENKNNNKGLLQRALSKRQKPEIVIADPEQEQIKIESNQMMELLKNSMDKFLPNLSALWHLNDDKPPPIMLFKIIKLLLNYSLLKRNHLNKIMDMLLDKAVILRNLEQLYYNEFTPESTSPTGSPTGRSEAGGAGDSKKMNPNELHKWSKVLIKYRQFFAEIMMMIFVYHMDDRMFDILRRKSDVNIQFDPFPEDDEEKFTKKDLLAIERLEKEVNFEGLGIFDEEMGSNYMRVFYGYVLSNPLDPPNKFTYKIKTTARLFMNFFANVNDINLFGLKLMNSDTINIINRPLYLTEAEAHSPENQAISEFVNYCETYYLNERQIIKDFDFSTDFKKKLNEIHQVLTPHVNDLNKSQLQDMLFQNNFLWILINLMLKYSKEFKGEHEMTKKLLDLFKICLDKNLCFQNMMIQDKVLRLLEFKKESLGRLGVELVELAFKKNPTMMVSNQNYLNLFFNYNKKSAESQNVFATEADYYNSRAKVYELLSHYLDEKYYGTAHQIPEYDLICLDNILNTEYTEEEFLDCKTIIEILKERNNPELKYKVHFFKHILNIIAKSSSKRSTKENNKKLRQLFSLQDLRIMLETVTDDYDLKTSIFRLYRNIYIFDRDNVFDDENKVYELVKPLIGQAPPKSSSSPKKPEDSSKKEDSPKKQDSIKLEEVKEEGQGTRGGGRGRGGRGGGGRGGGQAGQAGGSYVQRDYDIMIEMIKDTLTQFILDAKGVALKEEKEKKVFSSFGVTMLMSTINYLAKAEIQIRLLSSRRANVIKDMQEGKKPGEDLMNAPKDAANLFFLMLEQLKNEENETSFKKVFDLPEDGGKELKKVYLFEDIELEPLSEILKQEIHKFNEMVTRCEYYSSGKDKESYKIYNLGASTDVVKRFSNKLEDRQNSVRLPIEILKGLFLALKEKAHYDSFGMIMGALYESYKLRKLSTFSSMKKNFEDENIDNIYLRILKESKNKNDNIACNLCHFLITELGGGICKPKMVPTHVRAPSMPDGSPIKRPSVLDVQGALHRKDEEEGTEFVSGNRNNKYVLLEIFSNVIFHATEVFQENVYKMLEKPPKKPEMKEVGFEDQLEIIEKNEENQEESLDLDMGLLDSIWHELLLNFSFAYNRTRQDKVWKEYFQRTILLIKFHQYLCEENNADFKKVFRLCKVPTVMLTSDGKLIEPQRMDVRYNHINNIMGRFWFRCDWGKKNFILIKKGFMFPIVGAFFDFLTESMTGPYLENQKIITNMVAFKPLCSFLDTFEPKVQSEILGKGKHMEYDIAKIKNVYNIDVNNMNELKLSLCDFMLTCCEGHNEKILENQLKKINYIEILETVVKLIKALIFKYSKNSMITYSEYKSMKSVYKTSGFNEEQTNFLDMALKLFMYLKLMADYSHTLKHILENKEEIASEMVTKTKGKLKINTANWCQRKPAFVDDDENDEVDEKDFEDGLCLKFLGSFAKRLEIITGDEEDDLTGVQKELLFFEPNPKFSFLSEETKEQFIEDVDRSSHESKMHGLITSCTYFEEEINITEKMKQNHPKLSQMFSSYREYEIALFLLCCVINLFIVIDYPEPDETETDPEIKKTHFGWVIQILGIIMCVCSGLCFLVWMWLRFPIERKLNILRFCERRGCKISGIPGLSMAHITWETIFDENLVRVLLLHVICCILALTLNHGYGFYAVEIMAIVNLFGTFKYLAKSISLHWHQLLFTFFMVLIFLYIYSVFSNIYFYGNLDVCNDGIITCYFALLNTGFTNGMGIGGMLSVETIDKGARYFGYVFFDLMFFITVNCISLNLVFGIIVDTFGELREQNEKYGNFIF